MQSKMFRLMFLILRRTSRGALFVKPRGTPALISSRALVFTNVRDASPHAKSRAEMRGSFEVDGTLGSNAKIPQCKCHVDLGSLADVCGARANVLPYPKAEGSGCRMQTNFQ